VRESLRAAVEERLREVWAQTGLDGGVLVPDGPAVATIVQAARDQHASLVAVGTTGLSGLERLALGSVAEVVARQAPCSVLVVRPPGRR
jgi:nucleotide-binding universal stress UspA family protein